MRVSLIPMVLLLGCSNEPTPMPTEQAIASSATEQGSTAEDDDQDALTTLPLYQALYQAPLTGPTHASRQRVRLLVFLRHLDLHSDQLTLLDQLRLLAQERQARIQDAEADFVARRDAAEASQYDELWAALSRGVPLDSPELTTVAQQLNATRSTDDNAGGLLRQRMEAMRSILEAERPFLLTLSPEQEALFVDALFLLRQQLDPVGNPGDFHELVGTTYEPGQYAVLTRGTGDYALDPMDIGALWSDSPGLEGRALHQARREVLLYLLLLQPGLDQAIVAAQALTTQTAE